MTTNEIVNQFIAKYNEVKGFLDFPSLYYCGITNDLEQRLKYGHKVTGNYWYYKCVNVEQARDVEKKLGDAGFDIGDRWGNGSDDSVFVYMYRKITNVTQE